MDQAGFNDDNADEQDDWMRAQNPGASPLPQLQIDDVEDEYYWHQDDNHYRFLTFFETMIRGE